MKLNEIRNSIDLIDSRILKLLNDRMEQALLAKKFKNRIEDLEREKDLMVRLKQNPNALIDPEFTESLYKTILSFSKKIQTRDCVVTGFQGEHGAYSEEAARVWNKNFVTIPCITFNEVFEGVNSGMFDYGVVPVENTLGGIVGPVNELLINTDLKIIGAIDLPIHHSLLMLPGTDHREIREVYSHSQALAQCRRFLSRNNLTLVPYYDTAGAARMLAEKQPRGAACIASRLAAQLYNLDILKENIEDSNINRTRFLVLSKHENTEDGSKCSITFTTEHKSGTLFGILELFAKSGINLTRIESIPYEPGNYSFFLDFDGSLKDELVKTTLEKAEKQTSGFKILGCYNEKSIEDKQEIKEILK
jgi:prephenate dehydratase/chorismate mutase/prephenate dehydratase